MKKRVKPKHCHAAGVALQKQKRPGGYGKTHGQWAAKRLAGKKCK